MLDKFLYLDSVGNLSTYMGEEEENRKRMQVTISYMTLPFVLGIPPIVGWYLGSWLDRHFETAPYGMYTLLVLGLMGGARESYRIIKKGE